MAFASHIPSHLWTEAVTTVNYIVNRTSTRANDGVTLFKKLTGRAPSVAHFRTFGCRSFVLNTSPDKKKWAPRAVECVFMGYDSTSCGFRNYHPSSRRIIVLKDVQFDETSFICDQSIKDDSAPKARPNLQPFEFSAGSTPFQSIVEPLQNSSRELALNSSTGPVDQVLSPLPSLHEKGPLIQGASSG